MPTEIDEKKARWQRSRVWALSWLLRLMSQLEPEGVCSIVTGVQASFPMVSDSCGFHISVSSWRPLSSPPFFGRINSIPWSHLTRHNRSVSQAEELCDDSWLRRLTHISKICPVNVFDKPESRPCFVPPWNADEAGGEQEANLQSQKSVRFHSLIYVSFSPKRMVGNPTAPCQVAVSLDGEDCTGEVNH